MTTPARSRLAASVRGLAKRLLVALAYRGDRFHCPCCERSFRRFRDFGNPPRPDAQCPWCGSLERHRLLWLHLRRDPRFQHARRLLHLAPEPALVPLLRAVPGYVSSDLEDPRARVHADLVRPPFRDGLFDVIVCSHVLEHVDDDRAAMRAIRRLLAPGGIAVVQVPVDWHRPTTFEDPSVVTPEERRQTFGQSDHVRIYGRDVLERLRSARMDVRGVDGSKGLSNEEVRRHRADAPEGLFLCARTDA